MLEERRIAKNQATLFPVEKKKKKVSCKSNGYKKMLERLPPGSSLTLPQMTWADYEELLKEVGEASGLRISYIEGVIHIMTLSVEHEGYSRFIERLVDRISFILHIKILFFGSATMKKLREEKGIKPDACFYIQSIPLLHNPALPDYSVDPPPDVVVEIDIHHKSDEDKFAIYAALGVPEMWIYEKKKVSFYLLRKGKYVLVRKSKALPILTSKVLTEFINRTQKEDQYETLLAFEEWLNTLKK
jgi:Uma2 family endonuclease